MGTSTPADACAFTSDPKHSSISRRFQTGQTPEELAHMFRLLGVRVSQQQQRWKRSLSTRRDGHNAELASVTTNSDGKRSSIGNRRRYDVELEQTVTLHGDRESRRLQTWTSSTRHGDSDSHKKTQPIGEPLQIRSSALQGSHMEIHAP